MTEHKRVLGCLQRLVKFGVGISFARDQTVVLYCTYCVCSFLRILICVFPVTVMLPGGPASDEFGAGRLSEHSICK